MTGCAKYEHYKKIAWNLARKGDWFGVRIFECRMEWHMAHCQTCIYKNSMDTRELEREKVYEN